MSVFLRTLKIHLLLIATLCSQPALAYLGPGSGSGLLSIIIGFFVALGLTIKTYWYKLKSLFTRRKPSENDKDSSDNDADA